MTCVRHKPIQLGAVSLVAALTLAACGAENTTSGASSSPQTPGISTAAAAQAQPPAGETAAGQRVFRMRCAMCHVVDEGAPHRVGPNLYGFLGRDAGALEDFAYSPAMREADIVWTEETLEAYLVDPRGYIPNNRMAFVGLPDEAQRASLIAYLKEATAASED